MVHPLWARTNAIKLLVTVAENDLRKDIYIAYVLKSYLRTGKRPFGLNL